MYLSWIIPAYNEKNRIEKTIREVDVYLKSRRFDGGYEIIVVDSASPDHTAPIVRALTRRMPHLRLIEVKNRGKGWAVKQGMASARGEVAAFSDADNSVSPDQAGKFLDAVCDSSQKSGCADVVIGSIEIPGASIEEHSQQYRRMLGKLAKYVIRLVSGLWEIRDSQRGFKFFSRRAADVIFPKQTLARWGFDFEILLIAKRNGFGIRELPVRWVNPADSKVRLGAYVSTLIELLRVKWNDTKGRYANHR
ncbi:MAG: glycosyltransferase [Candidatus Sungbacteria bacterium]|nr:glycosyltransferase [Candidatus Sungbacteria bacterium]